MWAVALVLATGRQADREPPAPRASEPRASASREIRAVDFGDRQWYDASMGQTPVLRSGKGRHGTDLGRPSALTPLVGSLPSLTARRGPLWPHIIGSAGQPPGVRMGLWRLRDT